MRLLEGNRNENLQACVIGSPTFSRGIRPNLWVPLGEDVKINELETLNVVGTSCCSHIMGCPSKCIKNLCDGAQPSWYYSCARCFEGRSAPDDVPFLEC